MNCFARLRRLERISWQGLASIAWLEMEIILLPTKWM